METVLACNSSRDPKCNRHSSDHESRTGYRWGIEGGKFSEATALGLFQSVIGLILALAADFVAKRMGEEGLI